MRRVISGVAVAVVLLTCLSSASMAAAGPSAVSRSLRSADRGRAPSAPAGFACRGGFAGGRRNIGGPSAPSVTAVRVGHHGVYDRFVIQFSGSTMPSYRVTHHSTRFPFGTGSVKLEGTNGVSVRLFPVDGASYHGPARFLPRFPVLREARMVEYFEGYMGWGLGTRGWPCLRVAVFRSPTRLVVDVARP